MNFFELFSRHRALFFGVFAASLLGALAYGLLATRVYSGSALQTIVDVRAVAQPSDEGLSKPIDSTELITIFKRLVDLEVLQKEFPESGLVEITYGSVGRNNSRLVVKAEGTDPEKLATLLAALPARLNSIDHLSKRSADTLELVRAERARLSEVERRLSEFAAHTQSLLDRKDFARIAVDPMTLLGGVASLQGRLARLDKAEQFQGNGIVQPYAPPVVSARPVRPKVALNLVFWPLLTVVLLTFGLSLREQARQSA